jgi:hypothetical protein
LGGIDQITSDVAEALLRGYSPSATDTGHAGDEMDGSFALGHPEKLIDLGYRSEHEMTVKAKAIIAGFYGNAPKFSYWNGCSTGGRQGLREAQSYPQDYDGIIAGDPANPLDKIGSGAKTAEWLRLFMVPGMGHCRGGDGPNTFDAVTALEDWVEKGRAPDKIIASHSSDGKVDRTRPLCPYPQMSAYKGNGSIDEAANFVCKLQ